MPHTIDYQTLRKTQQQEILDLLDRLSSLSVAVRAVHEQMKHLFQQQEILLQKHTYWEQWHSFAIEESNLLQEYRATLIELVSLRQQKF